MVEYSRMQVPSLSSGCEIAQFFVRYMGRMHNAGARQLFRQKGVPDGLLPQLGL